MGLWSLGGGGGTALGSALAGWLLALVGYHSGAEVSFGLQEGLRSIIAFVPSALLLVALPLIALSLSRADMIQVEATLRRD
jgi:Na+/melibiose symporter-like transporter